MVIQYSDDYLVFDDPNSNQRHVISVFPIKLSDYVGSTLDYQIEADLIVVDKPVDFAGKSLKIRCRELRFLSGASLESNGRMGSPSYSSGVKPVGSQDPGHKGADGDGGGEGANGGAISIACQSFNGAASLRAIGGSGGRGMDGGDGIQGARGADKGRVEFERGSPEPPLSKYSGGTGGPGGAVGLPGKNGAGGGRGFISFISVTQTQEPFICRIGSGDSGPNAIPGNFGTGGVGGNPGPLVEHYDTGGEDILILESRPLANEETESQRKSSLESQKLLMAWSRADLSITEIQPMLEPPFRPRRSHYRKVRLGEPGQTGPGGDERAEEVALRQAFKPGQMEDIALEISSVASISNLYSESFLEMQTAFLEDEFRSRGLGVDDDFWKRVSFYMALSTDSQNPVIKGIFSRLCAMARKVQLGLDFFGYSQEYVPLLAMGTYRELLEKTILEQVRFIEQQFDGYVQKLEKADELLLTLRQVRNNSSAQVITLANMRTFMEVDLIGLAATIPAMNQSVTDALQQLLEAEEAFKDAVAAKAGGCGFVDTLISIGTLVAGVAATGGAFMAVVGSVDKFVETWNENNKSISTLWDAKNVLSKGLEPISSDFNDVNKGIQNIREAYASLTDERKAKALPAFSIEREKFDQITKDFTDMPEAAAYKSLGYAYLDRVDSRNRSVLDYNARLVRLMELIHTIDAAKIAESTAQSALLAATDPTAPFVFTRLKRIRRATLDSAAQLIHAQEKAMGYLFCTQVTPTISARNAAEIAAAHAVVNVSWIRAKESYKPIRTLISGAFRIQLKQFTALQDWNRFTEIVSGNRPLHLSIDVRNLASSDRLFDVPGLRVTGARLSFEGIELDDEDQIKWWIFQDGRESVLTQDNQVVRFSKLPTKALQGFISKSDVVDPDTSEDGIYSGFSIFSTWRLVVSEPRRKINFRELNDLTLAINGYYLG